MTIKNRVFCNRRYEAMVGSTQRKKLFPLREKHICAVPSEAHTTTDVRTALLFIVIHTIEAINHFNKILRE